MRAGRLAPLLLLGSLACAAKVTVPPTPFKDSDAFKQVRRNALGFLDHDFNGDGVPDAVVVTTSGPGMVTSVFVQSPSATGGVWSQACTGPMLVGEELDTLRWVKPGDRELLLVVASSDNPDMLQQSFALFPASAPCTVVFQEQIALAKPGYDLVSPGEVPGGVLVDDVDRVHVIDRPQTVQLRGSSGEIEVLKSVRERILDDDGTRILVTEQPRTFVEPRHIEARWQPQSAEADAPIVEPRLVPELVDENPTTSFVAAANQDGILEISSGNMPMVILDVAHGCGDGGVRLTLAPASAIADTHIVGDAPEPSSFIQGVGRRPRGAAAERRDVLVLRQPTTKLSLRVGPLDADRCLRDVRAYSFRMP